jgi:hypothetical protein
MKTLQHQGLLYGQNPAKCLTGPDWPQSPQSIMEDHNMTQMGATPPKCG